MELKGKKKTLPDEELEEEKIIIKKASEFRRLQPFIAFIFPCLHS
jgi:hypothetical protein